MALTYVYRIIGSISGSSRWMAFDPTWRLALVLEAVLRATLVHELGR